MPPKKSDSEVVREEIAAPAAPPLPRAGGSYTLVDGKLVPDAPEADAPAPDAAVVTEV